MTSVISPVVTTHGLKEPQTLKVKVGPSDPRPYIETPLVQSLQLSRKLGVNVWLKLEQAQPSGSFKSRGLGHLVYQTVVDNPGKRLRFFCASGGNAGYATACAAQKYNQDCTVCLPATSDPAMVSMIEMTGATVVVYGQTIARSDEHIRSVLLSESEQRGETAIYCHPYDHELVWQGNSTISDEIVAQSKDLGFVPDAVVCSVGGGGLYNGVVRGLQKAGWSDVRVVAVETEGCDTLAQSLKERRQVNMDQPSTIATSLATRNVCMEAINNALYVQPTDSVVCSDRDAVSACVKFANDNRLLVEPACGTALAPLYDNTLPPSLLQPGSNIIVVVCGGVNISWAKLSQHCDKYDVDFVC